VAKRLLLVHRYFWPDVPTYAQMLRFIGAHLSEAGHQVSVFCGPPSYNGVYGGPRRPRSEVVDRMRVHRVLLPPDRKSKPLMRAASLLVFAVRLIGHVVRHRSEYDLVTVTTIPPVVMGGAARIIKRLTGIPYLYHCMDLYPEVAVISGMARNRWLVKLAIRLDTSTCRKAAVVVVLSNDMRATLERGGLDGTNVIVLNNFEVLDGDSSAAESVVPRDAERFRVLFAGNMGRFQGLESLMIVAHRLAAEFRHT
jgi:colanic acid biosynthesis glycosyl transferase WcaI